MNIIDIQNIAEINDTPVNGSKKGSKKKNLVGGMSPDAHLIFKRTSTNLTREEIGVSDKKIIIPSFNTTSKLFAQHF